MTRHIAATPGSQHRRRSPRPACVFRRPFSWRNKRPRWELAADKTGEHPLDQRIIDLCDQFTPRRDATAGVLRPSPASLALGRRGRTLLPLYSTNDYAQAAASCSADDAFRLAIDRIT